MKILICRGNFETPKSYPHWKELLELLKDHEVKEIKGILTEDEIINVVNWSDIWITVDSFLPHLCTFKKLKHGIVLWGVSDPRVFGYETNINLLKSRDNLRSIQDQFKWWKDVPYNSDVFVTAEEIVKEVSIFEGKKN